jgi:hypothetical protein
LRPAATFTFARRIGFIAAGACFALAAAFAAEPKSNAAIKNKSVDAMGKSAAIFDAGGVKDFRRCAAQER